MSLPTSKNAQLHMLLSQCKLMPRKAELVSSFSSGRTEKSSELSITECIELINYLRQYLKGEPQPFNDDADKANIMRRKILSICHQLQWYKRDNGGRLILGMGRAQLDFARIDAYCIKYSTHHKPLQQHTLSELPLLVTQFQNVLKDKK